MKLSLTILVLMMALFLIFPALIPQQGYVLMFSIPVVILIARVFYQKGHRNSDRAVRGSGTEATDQNEAAAERLRCGGEYPGRGPRGRLPV